MFSFASVPESFVKLTNLFKMRNLMYVTLIDEDYLDEDVNLLPGVIRIGEFGCRITSRRIGFALPTEPGNACGIHRLYVRQITQNSFGDVQLTLYDESIKKEQVHLLLQNSVLQKAPLVKLINVITLTFFVALVGAIAGVFCALR